jgi:hypothetical protein
MLSVIVLGVAVPSSEYASMDTAAQLPWPRQRIVLGP